MTAFDNRHGGRDKPMHGVQARRLASVEVLRPVLASVLWRQKKLRPKLAGSYNIELGPARLASPLVQKQCCKQRSRCAPHELSRRMVNITGDELLQLRRLFDVR